MDQPTRQVFSANFDAGLQMLSHAVRICPDGLWQQHGRFYHLAYHTVIFADYYLTHPVRDFAPMLPYHLADPDDLPETAVDDVLPESAISRNQLLTFIEHIQKKNREFWAKDVDFEKRWIETDEIALHGLCPALVQQYSVTEIMFYNLRHLQHHAGQLNLLLRQHGQTPCDWVAARP